MKYTVHLKDDSYPITIERNAIQKIHETINTQRKIAIIADDGVPQNGSIAFINNVRMRLSYALNKEKHPSALPLMNPY